jgi:hypothetical protein
MKFWIALAVSLAVAVAQDPAAQRKNTDGEVQSVDTAAKQLSLKTEAGAVYAVTATDRTNIVRVGPDLDLKKASKIELKDIAAGDRVRARGMVAEDSKTIAATTIIVLTKADVAKKQEHDREEWTKRGIAGTVTAVNVGTREITVKVDTIPPRTVTVEAPEKAEFRRYAPDSVKFSDAKPGSFADVKVGDRVRALGDKNEDGSRFKAEEIVSGSFRTLAAQVVSIDPTANIIKVKDLSTKDKEPVTIHVNSDTVIRRMPERMAMFMAMRLNAPNGGPGAGEARSGGPASGGPGGARRDAPGAAGNGMRGDFGPGAGGRGAAGGPGGSGGPAGNFQQMGGPAHGDLHQMLERLPKVELAELKAGDALVISSTNGADRNNLTAITIVAGVEPFLAAAPKSSGAVDLGSWNFDIGMPAQ